MTDEQQPAPKPLTIQDIKKMSQAEVNENWPAVSEALTVNRQAEPEEEA